MEVSQQSLTALKDFNFNVDLSRQLIKKQSRDSIGVWSWSNLLRAFSHICRIAFRRKVRTKDQHCRGTRAKHH